MPTIWGLRHFCPTLEKTWPGVEMARPCVEMARPGVEMARPGVEMARVHLWTILVKRSNWSNWSKIVKMWSKSGQAVNT